MPHAGLIGHVVNPLVQAFLHEHLDEFVDDVLIFANQILAHVPSEDKSFVESAGLAFYSAPIVSFVSDLPWQTIKTAITDAVSEVFHERTSNRRQPENGVPGALDKNHAEEERIEQAIVAAFAKISVTAEDAMGAILTRGIAHLLGRYIALCTAGILDGVVEHESRPILQVPSTGPAKKGPAD